MGGGDAVTTSRRLHIVHTTTFTYPRAVEVSYNEIRMTPISEPNQQVHSSQISVLPQTWKTSYTDYWGTKVTVFEALTPHAMLTVVAEHAVEVHAQTSALRNWGWEEISTAETVERLSEFLGEQPVTQIPVELRELVNRCRTDDPHTTAVAISELVRAQITYLPGATGVQTLAGEAWERRAGVCQDIAHLTIGALRDTGIAARYVSGYLYAGHDELDVPIRSESHAWVEWWVGHWVGYDPTNGVPAGLNHVVLGRGRSYEDVAPLRGVYAGQGESQLEVEVQITRES